MEVKDCCHLGRGFRKTELHQLAATCPRQVSLHLGVSIFPIRKMGTAIPSSCGLWLRVKEKSQVVFSTALAQEQVVYERAFWKIVVLWCSVSCGSKACPLQSSFEYLGQGQGQKDCCCSEQTLLSTLASLPAPHLSCSHMPLIAVAALRAPWS